MADKAGGHVRAGPDVSAACFEVPSAYEITARGRKLIGSAQSRRSGYVLQHGSLPLVGDIGRLVDILVLSDVERALLRQELTGRAGTLAQALGVGEDSEVVQFERVASSLCVGFRNVLNLSLQSGQPSAGELRRAAQLIREQFGNPQWTYHR